MKKNQVKPQRIAITWHPNLPDARIEAEVILQTIRDEYPEVTSVAAYSLYDEDFHRSVKENGLDAVITLGGDGTMLRTNKICAPYEIPVCGVNMGSFGFMMEIQRNKWRKRLKDLIAGKWMIEERMMLNVKLLRKNGGTLEWEVLNDAVVGHGSQLRPIRIHVVISGNELTTYVADGLIVATATGSTAYAMAAGGPIMEPELRNLLVIPVAPHLSLDRSLLLKETDVVEITATSNHEAIFSPDGAKGMILLPTDLIRISASKFSAKYIRFDEKGFYYRNFLQYMQRNPSAIG